MTIEVEMWGRISGHDEMQLLGTIEYHLEGADLPVGVPAFTESLEGFVKQINETMAVLGPDQQR